MSLPTRIVYWASLISTGTVAGIFSLPIVLTGRLKHAHILSKIFVQSALAALPVPIVIAAYSGGLSGSWPLLNWPTQYFSALVVSILIHSCMYMLFVTLGWIPDSKSTSKSQVQDSHAPGFRFMQRLSIKYQAAELFAVSSEDHYVQAHTSQGKELILMRLSDALKELNEIDGLQIHRSWWVAREGISESVKENGKHCLVLKSGDRVPVSRSFTERARNAKLID